MNQLPVAFAYILFGVSVFGLFVQAIGMVLIVWRGGNMIGSMRTTLDILGSEVSRLRATTEETTSTLSRVVALVDNLQSRVERLAT
jgi:hypothetical protein